MKSIAPIITALAITAADAREVRHVDVAEAGQSAAGALNKVGIHCNVTFGGRTAVITYDDDTVALFALESSDVLLVTGHHCTVRDLTINGNDYNVTAVRIEGEPDGTTSQIPGMQR